MARFLFNTDSLSERGTETSAYFLACELKRSNHDVTFSYGRDNINNNERAINAFKNIFPLLPYNSFGKLEREIRGHFDIAYLIKNRETKPKVFKGLFNAAHVVFDEYNPYAQTYTYFSKSLSEFVRDTTPRHKKIAKYSEGLLRGCKNARKFDFIPPIVDIPKPSNQSARSNYGIPEDAFVIFRYGGRTTMNIAWVKRTLISFLEEHKDCYFVGVNTDKFVENPRAIFLDTIVDMQEKADLLATSDVFLHARSEGETFGLSIIESLQANTPVLAWSGGRDREHVAHLKQFDLLYEDSFDLWNQLKFMRNHTKYEKKKEGLFDSYTDTFRGSNLLRVYLEKMFHLETS